MCDLNGPFRLCTCSDELDYTKPHWILRMNSTNDSEETMVTVCRQMNLNFSGQKIKECLANLV
jgi:hypothetical protein